MLGLSPPSLSRVAPLPTAEALRRALETAGTVSGGYAGAPCAFVPLASDAAGLLAALRPPGATAGTWVLVTAQATDEDGHRAHLRERTLTAAQRFVLALACDGIDGRWVETTPETEALVVAALPLGRHRPVGAVWCSG